MHNTYFLLILAIAVAIAGLCISGFSYKGDNVTMATTVVTTSDNNKSGGWMALEMAPSPFL